MALEQCFFTYANEAMAMTAETATRTGTLALSFKDTLPTNIETSKIAGSEKTAVQKLGIYCPGIWLYSTPNSRLFTGYCLKTLMDTPATKTLVRTIKAAYSNLEFFFKDFEVKISGNRGFLEAIITRGGVDTGDINPSTMESCANATNSRYVYLISCLILINLMN